MQWKRRVISGLFLEALSVDVMSKNDCFYVFQGNSFPVPLKHVDAVRRTNTSLDALQARRVDDCWNVDGDQKLSGPWTNSPNSQYWIMLHLKGVCVPVREKEKIQPTSRPEYKWPKDWEQFIILLWNFRNSKKLQTKTLKEHWNSDFLVVLQAHFSEITKNVSNAFCSWKITPRSEGKMHLLFTWSKISRSALPSGKVRPSVRTVVVRDPRGFMWKRALWLARMHTSSTLLTLRRKYPCQRTWTLRKKILKFFGFWKKTVQITQSILTLEYWAPTWCNRNQEVVTFLFTHVWNGGHVWCHWSRQLQRNHANWSWRGRSQNLISAIVRIWPYLRGPDWSLFIRADKSNAKVSCHGGRWSFARNLAENRLPLRNLENKCFR